MLTDLKQNSLIFLEIQFKMLIHFYIFVSSLFLLVFTIILSSAFLFKISCKRQLDNKFQKNQHMKQYQFKTVYQSSPYSQIKGQLKSSTDYQGKIGYSNTVSTDWESPSPTTKNWIKNQHSFPAPISDDLNINDMKKRLDILLKQTEGVGTQKHRKNNKTLDERNGMVNDKNIYVSSFGSKEKGHHRSTNSSFQFKENSFNLNKLSNKNQMYQGFHNKIHSSSTSNVLNESRNYALQSNINMKGPQSFGIQLKIPNNFPLINTQKELKTHRHSASTYRSENFEGSKITTIEILNEPNIKAKLEKTNNMMNSTNRQTPMHNFPIYSQSYLGTRGKRQETDSNEMHSSTNSLQPGYKPQSYQNLTGSTNMSESFYSSHLNGKRYGTETQTKEETLQIPATLYECKDKLKNFHSQILKLKRELTQMTDSKEYYRKQLSQEWRNNKKIKDQYQEKISQLTKKYEGQIYTLRGNLRKKQASVIELVNKITSDQPAETFPDEKTQQFIEENKKLLQTLEQKQKAISELNRQILAKNLDIQKLTHNIQTLSDELKMMAILDHEKKSIKLENNFDEILKIQLKSITEFKEMIERLNKKNNQLRERLLESERKCEMLNNENKINELKFMSKLNGYKIQASIEVNEKDNIIATVNRKMTTTEERYKAALNEIRAKDEFLKRHLLGRVEEAESKEYVESVLSKYRKSFTENCEEQLKQDLDKALKKIQLYERYS